MTIDVYLTWGSTLEMLEAIHSERLGMVYVKYEGYNLEGNLADVTT